MIGIGCALFGIGLGIGWLSATHFAYRAGVLAGYAATHWTDDPFWNPQRKIINDSRAAFGLKPIEQFQP